MNKWLNNNTNLYEKFDILTSKLYTNPNKSDQIDKLINLKPIEKFRKKLYNITYKLEKNIVESTNTFDKILI